MRIGILAFIATFLAIYGGLHYYIYRKLIILVPGCRWLIIPILVFLLFSPIVISRCAHAGFTTLAVPLAWTGYTWMGFVLLFVTTAAIADVSCLVMKGVMALSGVHSPLFSRIVPFYATLIALVIAAAAAAYGFFAAQSIHVTRIDFPTSKLDTNEQFRIVQISDLHLGLLTNASRVRRLVAIINGLHPDIIVSTGDLVDMQHDHVANLVDILRELHARYGKFAVTGNHEGYTGVAGAATFTQRTGFTMLSFEAASTAAITIVGVDDPMVTRRLGIVKPAEQTVLQNQPRDKFMVLLKHQPVVNSASVPWFDLQLSGHIHGGQIFPFGLLTKLAYHARTGLSRAGTNAWLYVSRGTGTWGPPIRFLVPPEVIVIELHHGTGAPSR